MISESPKVLCWLSPYDSVNEDFVHGFADEILKYDWMDVYYPVSRGHPPSSRPEWRAEVIGCYDDKMIFAAVLLDGETPITLDEFIAFWESTEEPAASTAKQFGQPTIVVKG